MSLLRNTSKRSDTPELSYSSAYSITANAEVFNLIRGRMEKFPEDLQTIGDKVIKAAMFTIEGREKFVGLPMINGTSFTKEDLKKLIVSSHQAFYEAIGDSKKGSVAANDAFYGDDRMAA